MVSCMRASQIIRRYAPILLLLACNGCHVESKCRQRCFSSCMPDPEFYGYEPTCWQAWPEGWMTCPPPGLAGAIHGTKLPEGLPTPKASSEKPKPVKREIEEEAVPENRNLPDEEPLMELEERNDDARSRPRPSRRSTSATPSRTAVVTGAIKPSHEQRKDRRDRWKTPSVSVQCPPTQKTQTCTRPVSFIESGEYANGSMNSMETAPADSGIASRALFVAEPHRATGRTQKPSIYVNLTTVDDGPTSEFKVNTQSIRELNDQQVDQTAPKESRCLHLSAACDEKSFTDSESVLIKFKEQSLEEKPADE
jgi:hypothetical protein